MEKQVIFEFLNYNIIKKSSPEIRKFEIKLESNEVTTITISASSSRVFSSGIKDNVIRIKFDLSIQSRWLVPNYNLVD